MALFAKTSVATLLALVSQLAMPCHSETISPSLKTREFSAPKSDYFQQVTKGHPFRWFDTDMALRVLIKPGGKVPHFKPEYEEILRLCFKEWEARSEGRIKFKFVTEAPADITCKFVTEFTPKQKPSVAGLTLTQSSPHHVDLADISIKTISKIVPMTEDVMRAICLHEIGHSLGILNHSSDPHDIMYPYWSAQISLSTRDINTIQKLYDFKPPDQLMKLASKPYQDPNYPYPNGNIVLSSDDYDAYTRAIAQKLLKYNKPFPASPMLECRISFLVDSAGNIFNYRTFQGSSNDEFDQKALTSLLWALPLPPAPESLRKNKWSKLQSPSTFVAMVGWFRTLSRIRISQSGFKHSKIHRPKK